jgi:hypothetical protein
MAFNIYAKIEIFYDNFFSILNVYVILPCQKKRKIICLYRCGSSAAEVVSYYGDMAKRVVYFYILIKKMEIERTNKQLYTLLRYWNESKSARI